MIRWTWSGRIEGYLPYPLDQARIVRTIEVDAVDADTGEILGALVGGSED